MSDDGGPVYPTRRRVAVPGPVPAYEVHPGISLRDYFAAHAPTPRDQMPLDEHAAYRYRYADAMLEARIITT